jgi:hypothetical protein
LAPNFLETPSATIIGAPTIDPLPFTPTNRSATA